MKKVQKISLLILTLTLGFGGVKKATAQTNVDTLVKVFDQLTDKLLYRNNDTNYIKNYSDQVAAKVVAVNKINYFRVKDKESKNTLKFRPVRDINLGIGLAYKFFAFDLTIALGLGDKTGLENTRSIDFQARMFTSKQLASVTFQYYQGYRLSGVNGTELDPNNPETRREDLRTTNLMMQYLYAFNYTKFSMKAPFVFNERQKKSAGSVVLGASFSLFNLSADSSIVPVVIEEYFNPSTELTGMNVMNLGLRVGYMYTFVFKEHFFVTASLSPGLVLNYGDYSLDYLKELPTNLSLSLSSMNSIGYNGNKFFGGFSLIVDNFYTTIDSRSRVEVGSGKVSAFVGYRFGKL